MAAKRSKALMRVNVRRRLTAAEDGTTSAGDVTLWLDPRGSATFCFEVPAYIQQALGVGPLVSAHTADKAEHDYEALVRRYSLHVMPAQAEPVVVVYYGYATRDADFRYINTGIAFDAGQNYEKSTAVGIAYTLAFRVKGYVHYRTEDTSETAVRHTVGREYAHGQYRPGKRMPLGHGVVMEYTPELHARLDALIAELGGATQVLHGLRTAKHPAAALMALPTGLLPAPAK